MHLRPLYAAFLECDEERVGRIEKSKFIKMIVEKHLQFPADFLFNFLLDI